MNESAPKLEHFILVTAVDDVQRIRWKMNAHIHLESGGSMPLWIGSGAQMAGLEDVAARIKPRKLSQSFVCPTAAVY